jgi:hypothetical protein
MILALFAIGFGQKRSPALAAGPPHFENHWAYRPLESVFTKNSGQNVNELILEGTEQEVPEPIDERMNDGRGEN